ncbi:MAG: aminotransferase class I/II-fold pyridoxal phosphate-dependent enzyme [Erysipelotrichaceae bacterium]|nr:aminotransferase class I/II-fold pyridoxal phosphate-dependent enzyme [Erysipelotrichaceae bacterium]
MYSFANDYSEGACPKVLSALIQSNNVQSAGYGLDTFCEAAANIVKQKIEHDDVDVHFITGGTPCNVLAISTLRTHEAVICVESGHINTHETGAVEATGHKIISVKGRNGKITPEEIRNVVASHPDEHMVKPKMVFISNATEFGTIYKKQELSDIYETCKELGLYLYLDGARLGNALVATGNDLTFKDICDLTDIFYIGGTKNGALLGEAMVIRNDDLKPDFRYLIKQHCSMLAKGRVIGVQFLALLEDKTYLDNARNANIMAQALKYIFSQFAIPMYIDSPTNQIFPVLDNKLLEKIQQNYEVIKWGPYDEKRTIVRFVCSWATKKSDIQNFYNDLVTYINNK